MRHNTALAKWKRNNHKNKTNVRPNNAMKEKKFASNEISKQQTTHRNTSKKRVFFCAAHGRGYGSRPLSIHQTRKCILINDYDSKDCLHIFCEVDFKFRCLFLPRI